jgi:hypothetical protein
MEETDFWTCYNMDFATYNGRNRFLDLQICATAQYCERYKLCAAAQSFI